MRYSTKGRQAAIDVIEANGMDDGTCAASDLVDAILSAYSDALPAEPEIEGGVRVRIMVGVDEDDFAWWEGSIRAEDGWQRYTLEETKRSGRQHVTRIVEATVPPYASPAEPVVEGRVVE